MEEIMSTKKDECVNILKECLKIGVFGGKRMKKRRKKIVEHSLRVRKICKYIIKSMPIELSERDRKMIYRSAIFHDVGRALNDDEDHHLLAMDILTGFFEKDEDLEKICNIIRCHKCEFDPCEDSRILAAVLRAADKIDKLYKGPVSESRKSLKKSLKRIRKFFTVYSDEAGYEKLEEACWHVWRELHRLVY